LAAAGRPDRARALAEQAEAAARETGASERRWAFTNVIRAHVNAGSLDRAEAMAGSVTERGEQAELLTELARAVAGAGRLDRARALAERAEAVARTISDDHPETLTDIVPALGAAGDPDRAEAVAGLIAEPHRRAWALIDAAQKLAAGDPDRAAILAHRAENIARDLAATDDLDRAAGSPQTLLPPCLSPSRVEPRPVPGPEGQTGPDGET
jgi:hypothetical protein